MLRLKEVWKDPVGSKLIAGAIAAIALGAWATLKGWWPRIGTTISEAWSWLGASSMHSNWLLVILWLCASIVVFIIGAIIVANIRSSNESQPRHWKDYRADQFFGLQWYWRLGDDAFIYNLFPLCMDCKCQVQPVEAGYYGSPQISYYCDVCKANKATFQESHQSVEDRVKLRIQKNLRTDEWANKGN